MQEGEAQEGCGSQGGAQDGSMQENGTQPQVVRQGERRTVLVGCM